jgi:hypothetical protein
MKEKESATSLGMTIGRAVAGWDGGGAAYGASLPIRAGHLAGCER